MTSLPSSQIPTRNSEKYPPRFSHNKVVIYPSKQKNRPPPPTRSEESRHKLAYRRSYLKRACQHTSTQECTSTRSHPTKYDNHYSALKVIVIALSASINIPMSELSGRLTTLSASVPVTSTLRPGPGVIVIRTLLPVLIPS